MRSLQQWKAIVIGLEGVIPQTRNHEARAEFIEALAYARRQVNRLTGRRLSISRWLWIVLVVFACGLVSGCATMSGLGTDISNVSDGLASYRSAK